MKKQMEAEKDYEQLELTCVVYYDDLIKKDFLHSQIIFHTIM